MAMMVPGPILSIGIATLPGPYVFIGIVTLQVKIPTNPKHHRRKHFMRPKALITNVLGFSGGDVGAACSDPSHRQSGGGAMANGWRSPAVVL